MNIDPLTAHFAAEITGVDLTQALDAETVSALQRALDDHSVLVFREQRFDDDSQIAFSQRFGPLENMLYKREGDGNQPISNITNIDFRTGELFPPDHSRLRANSGNQRWHSDSSFKKVPAYCSMLSGREVPPFGGDTQFASCRAAYEALDADQQAELDGLAVVHDYAWSRSKIAGYEAPQKALDQVPPVTHPLLRENPHNKRINFFAGGHAARIEGWPEAESRRLLDELLEHATKPKFVYAHQWRQFDFVIWDNRCVLHRATAFEVEKYRRDMRRTTVAGLSPVT